MDYKATLNLPKTAFPMKANLAQREPETVARWQREGTYAAMLSAREHAAPFLLHDGPPYANGHIHIGHMLNKVLKDIVVKSRAMGGRYTPYVPGWDCHGLPIELAVEKNFGKERIAAHVVEFREACRAYAEKYVQIQREEFERLGILGDWAHPYRTMDYAYQAEIARSFAAFVERGAVYSGKRPIHWCASCKTALAEAEVEYEDHRSPSIYVKFALTDPSALQRELGLGASPVSLVIWTTTPWTIPANLAIALHAELPYVAVGVGDETWIVAEGLLATMMTTIGVSDYTIQGPVSATALERQHAQHPLIARESLVVLGAHVTLEAGTGCVHTAPGHGEEDFHLGKQYDLPPLAPVDDAGCFAEDVGLDWLVGKPVRKANAEIIERLNTAGALVYAHEVHHQYPHCWRCRQPILFRVTEQWFVSMDASHLRQEALAGIQHVQWIPPWGRNRIASMVEGRPDWCISRQRHWGIPIIAVRCEACDVRGTTPALIRHVADRFAKEGADSWYSQPVDALLPKDYACPHCARQGPFAKEYDILDVWFDSGSSFAAAMEPATGLKAPASLYLEGSDQHRGWFNSSLFVGLGTRGLVPYEAVLTHGFVVDGDGKKYSKSAKNYVPADKLLKQHGAEILRLWVASEDYRHDLRVSEEILKRLIESYRKIRNTWRFLLGNIADFDPTVDAVAYDQLPELDRWLLHQCAVLVQRCRKAYDAYEFHTVYHAVNEFCTVTLSARYLDMCKDRLYCGAKAGDDRRGAQTVMHRVAETLTRLVAPILSFTAEEVWGYLPGAGDEGSSIFVADLPEAPMEWRAPELADRWNTIWDVREVALKALEEARNAKLIGNALGAALTLQCPDDARAALESCGVPLPDIFIVSQATFGAPAGDYCMESEEVPGVKVSVATATGAKCGRCWKLSETVGESEQFRDVCTRCAQVLTEYGTRTTDDGIRTTKNDDL